MAIESFSEPNPYRAPETPIVAGADPEAEADTLEVAPAAQRLAAALIDGLIAYGAGGAVYLLAILLGSPLAWAAGGAVPGDTAGFVAVLALLGWLLGTLGYFVVMESSWNEGTLGKMLFGIRVVDLQGRRIRTGRSVLRTLCKFITLLPWGIGAIWIFLTERRQTLHDKIAKTLVVCAPKALDSYDREALDKVIAEYRARSALSTESVPDQASGANATASFLVEQSSNMR
jgi:uncharacterized RDD family membrane protein YckC